MRRHARRLAALALVLGGLAAPGAAQKQPPVYLNELDADQGARDTTESIEIFAPCGGVALHRYALVLYDGATDQAYRAVSLAGQVVPADAHFVVGAPGVPEVDFSPPGWPAVDAVHDGPAAVALWYGLAGPIDPADFLGTTPATPPHAVVLMDALVHGTADPDDASLLAALTPGQPQVDEDAHGAAATESCQRLANDSAPFETSAWVAAPATPGDGNPGEADPWSDLGGALSGALGAPQLAGHGPLVIGTTGRLELVGAAPLAPGLLYVGLASAGGTPFKGGTLWPQPLLLALPLVTGAAGTAALPWSCWPGAPSGTTLYLQAWVADATAPHGAAASNGLLGTAP